MGYPSWDHREGGKDFFRKKKGAETFQEKRGQVLFFEKELGGEDFLSKM